MPLVADASLRAALYPQDRAAGRRSAAALAHGEATPAAAAGRYVRIELPRRGTLTLAEVEVTSGGRNVARAGKATQKNTAYGGDAARAIDGNTSGEYGDGGQTHTEENTGNPWWEVDLGGELPIESVTVYNRTDGDLGRRLDGFTLKVLDADRKVVFEKDRIDAPRKSVTVQVGDGDPAAAVRTAAMLALTYVRGQEAKTFALLAPLVGDPRPHRGDPRPAAHCRAPTGRTTRHRGLFDTVSGYLARRCRWTSERRPRPLDALEFGRRPGGPAAGERSAGTRADG